MHKTYNKEIEACKYLIKRLKAGYGANCKTSDVDDFGLKQYKNHQARCGSCRAKETIDFLKEHIALIKTVL